MQRVVPESDLDRVSESGIRIWISVRKRVSVPDLYFESGSGRGRGSVKGFVEEENQSRMQLVNIIIACWGTKKFIEIAISSLFVCVLASFLRFCVFREQLLHTKMCVFGTAGYVDAYFVKKIIKFWLRLRLKRVLNARSNRSWMKLCDMDLEALACKKGFSI